MKKLTLSMVALGLLTASASSLAATPAPVPAAIADHQGPIRIAVIRNLGSDDNTSVTIGQFCAQSPYSPINRLIVPIPITYTR